MIWGDIMNKKGFTVIELIVSFVLVITIATLLLQMVILLKNIYTSSGVKTEMLNKQAVISRQINKSLIEKEVSSVSNCGDYCIMFTYNTNETEELKIDIDNKIITFGKLHFE